jgi:hypothetical protein
MDIQSIVTMPVIDLKGDTVLFKTGVVNCLPGAREILGLGNNIAEATANSAAVDAKLGEFVRRHITGDFGLMPAESAKVNTERLATNDNIMSMYLLDNPRTERFSLHDAPPANAIYLLTLKDGEEVSTFVGTGREICAVYERRAKLILLKILLGLRDGPVQDLAGIKPAGNA